MMPPATTTETWWSRAQTLQPAPAPDCFGVHAGACSLHRRGKLDRVIDTNHYSLDPALVGRRVEVSVDQRTVTAVCLDSGEVACRHARVFARHRTITALEHARAVKAARGDCAHPSVEVRPLARSDALIA